MDVEAGREGDCEFSGGDLSRRDSFGGVGESGLSWMTRDPPESGSESSSSESTCLKAGELRRGDPFNGSVRDVASGDDAMAPETREPTDGEDDDGEEDEAVEGVERSGLGGGKKGDAAPLVPLGIAGAFSLSTPSRLISCCMCCCCRSCIFRALPTESPAPCAIKGFSLLKMLLPGLEVLEDPSAPAVSGIAFELHMGHCSPFGWPRD